MTLFCLHYLCKIEYKGGDTMTQKQLAEILAVFGKLKIENNPNLTHYEKELLKSMIDEIKREIR